MPCLPAIDSGFGFLDLLHVVCVCVCVCAYIFLLTSPLNFILLFKSMNLRVAAFAAYGTENVWVCHLRNVS